MDNLRSLNSSLPTPTSSRRHRSRHDRQHQQQNQQALLQAFKTAALSVTNLYRAAAADGTSPSYTDGYRDALEGLVDFLDREDLGLTDGEGWRVRQYLADKLAQSPTATGGQSTATDGSEDEAGDGEEDKRARSSSPVAQTKTPPQEQQQQSPAHSERPTTTPSTSSSTPPPRDAGPHLQFTFEAGPHPAPQLQDMDMDAPTPQHQQQQATHRTPRTQRHSMLRPNSNSHNRSAASSVGTKRKLSTLDFFDISAFSNGRDGTGGGGGGGGKRNRPA